MLFSVKASDVDPPLSGDSNMPSVNRKCGAQLVYTNHPLVQEVTGMKRLATLAG